MDDPGLLASCWPHRGNGSIVVTSRNKNICHGRSGDAKVIEIGGLTNQLGGDLVFDRLRQQLRASENAQELCNKLSSRFDNWPLVLRQLSAYMNKSHTDPQKMLEMLEKTNDVDGEIFSYGDDTELYQEYHDSLATAWGAILRKLPGDSARFLNLLALLDPDKIPDKLFYGDGIAPRKGFEFLGSQFQ